VCSAAKKNPLFSIGNNHARKRTDSNACFGALAKRMAKKRAWKSQQQGA
jgi:hypothetical protein